MDGGRGSRGGHGVQKNMMVDVVGGRSPSVGNVRFVDWMEPTYDRLTVFSLVRLDF